MTVTVHQYDGLLTYFQGNPRLTRTQLEELSGLSRLSISQKIKSLISAQALIEIDYLPSVGGRKAALFSINPAIGYVGICYFSATFLTVAVADMTGAIVASKSKDIDISDGPNVHLSIAVDWLGELLKKIPKSKQLGIIIGVPGPVSHNSGKVVSAPIMKGWSGVDIASRFKDQLKLPAFLENDVNLMAIAEHRLVYPKIENLLLIKLGTGIGSGLIINGELFRGSDGSAGDIGHNQFDALEGMICRCGRSGCLESFSSGWSLVERVQALGYKVKKLSEIEVLARNGNVEIIILLKRAAELIGHALADAVNLFNPSKVVIQGLIIGESDQILATIKEAIYQRGAALATSHLEIVRTKLGEDRGILGAAQLGLDRYFFSKLKAK
ncbi:MAG: ROK family protein [Streptomycetaceae bacterium]|nr:MAG: ROK family protein [Streptomycetaceae bacterium]